MALKDIQLCHMDPEDRANQKFSVTAHDNDGKQQATFECTTEFNARMLRNAIRDYADKLRYVVDYRR